MRGDIFRRLIEAHSEDDDASFRKAVLQLAASDSAAGHARIADEIRTLVASLPTTARSNVVDIAQPRGELADILEGRFREERLRDIVLTDTTRADLIRVLQGNRARAALEAHGVQPRRRLLFHGPPGGGKTLTAAVIAGEMGLPLMTVRLAALFSRFLGATATHLRAVFQEMPRRPGVYLFDEFDAIGQARDDAQDVGEMRRVVTSFLQFIDADRSPSLLSACCCVAGRIPWWSISTSRRSRIPRRFTGSMTSIPTRCGERQRLPAACCVRRVQIAGTLARQRAWRSLPSCRLLSNVRGRQRPVVGI